MVLHAAIEILGDENDPDPAPFARDGDLALVALKANERLPGKAFRGLHRAQAALLLEFERQGVPSRFAFPSFCQSVQVPQTINHRRTDLEADVRARRAAELP